MTNNPNESPVVKRARELWEQAELRLLSSPHTVPTAFEGQTKLHFINLAKQELKK